MTPMMDCEARQGAVIKEPLKQVPSVTIVVKGSRLDSIHGSSYVPKPF